MEQPDKKQVVRALQTGPECSLGFNGCVLDKATGCYNLGNGYRLYNPVLRSFYSPDSLSPFGIGGVNRYQYCYLNPVAFVDPSGHLSWQAGVGIGLGVLGIIMSVFTLGASLALVGAGTLLAGGLGIASAVLGLASASTGIASAALEESDPDMSVALGWASLGLGVGSMVLGGASAVANRMARGAASLYPRFPVTRIGENPARTIFGGMNVSPNRISGHGYPFNALLKYNGVQATNGIGLANAVSSEIGGSSKLLTLTTCFGGFGGRVSAGQLLANTTGRSVAAARWFHVAANGGRDINTFFTPITGVARIMSDSTGIAISSVMRAGMQGSAAAASGLISLAPQPFFRRYT